MLNSVLLKIMADELKVTRTGISRKSKPGSNILTSSNENIKMENKSIKNGFETYLGPIFLMISFPSGIIVANIICNETKCNFTTLSDLLRGIRNSEYLDVASLLVHFGYYAFLALLCMLPIGGEKVKGMPTKRGIQSEYRMNGLFCAVVIFITFLGLEIYGIPAIAFVNEKQLQLASVSVLFAFLMALYVYWRSFFVPLSALNPYGSTSSRIYNFWMGRELNPRIFKVDLKMFFLRFLLITSVILIFINLIPNMAELKNLNSLNLTALTLFMMLFLYLLEMFFFEKSWITSFECQYEGGGYLYFLAYSTYPFILSTNIKYIVDNNINLPTWELLALAFVFLIGYTIYRCSNSQKDAFRQNPNDPALAHLKTLVTPQGKKLLISGYWGLVRKPNYLGDILMQLSWASFTFFSLPNFIFLFSIAYLVHRVSRDNARCKERYGTTWDQYCQIVKYRLIPKIY